jgi:hypothetical protein
MKVPYIYIYIYISWKTRYLTKSAIDHVLTKTNKLIIIYGVS